ncbi:MAG: YbaB/EbfC family nucleoid-associated protein [Actinobacteria bacterium]|nr:YbaB/EbfC family nucleoid-associated protein [Actinomycetota bacterium]
MNRDELDQMMKQVQQMQAQMLEAQETLAEETVEGTAGGGVVRAEMSGSGDLRSISIAPDVVDPEEVEMLQDLIVAAINDAARRASELQAQRLGNVAGGLGDVGGLGGLLGP